jgi:hypothetical protein
MNAARREREEKELRKRAQERLKEEREAARGDEDALLQESVARAEAASKVQIRDEKKGMEDRRRREEDERERQEDERKQMREQMQRRKHEMEERKRRITGVSAVSGKRRGGGGGGTKGGEAIEVEEAEDESTTQSSGDQRGGGEEEDLVGLMRTPVAVDRKSPGGGGGGRGKVILIMTVDIGDGRNGKIQVHENDSAEDLAHAFAEEYGLGENVIPPLTAHIQRNVEDIERVAPSKTRKPRPSSAARAMGAPVVRHPGSARRPASAVKRTEPQPYDEMYYRPSSERKIIRNQPKIDSQSEKIASGMSSRDKVCDLAPLIPFHSFHLYSNSFDMLTNCPSVCLCLSVRLSV